MQWGVVSNTRTDVNFDPSAPERLAVDGVILLDKPTGASSNAVLQRVKRLLAARKAGHVGTLDPLASGLLPICLGEATKFSGSMLAADKEYEADLLLGATSTTGDAEGEITSRHPVNVSYSEVKAVIEQFRGEILQTPPIFSALKRNGKPLYSYARAGETVEIAPRTVTIRSIALTEFNPPNVRFVVRCSKGTYIRVLGEDIGRQLGCGGLLAGLRRTGVGDYDVSSSVKFDVLEASSLQERRAMLRPIDSLVARLPKLELDRPSVRLVCTGRHVVLPEFSSGIHRLYDPNGGFLGVAEVVDGVLVPRRMIATSPDAVISNKPNSASY
jgi:tRNA pseudouridine55 synthase